MLRFALRNGAFTARNSSGPLGFNVMEAEFVICHYWVSYSLVFVCTDIILPSFLTLSSVSQDSSTFLSLKHKNCLSSVNVVSSVRDLQKRRF